MHSAPAVLLLRGAFDRPARYASRCGVSERRLRMRRGKWGSGSRRIRRWMRSEVVGSSRLRRWAEPCSLRHYRQRCSGLGPSPASIRITGCAGTLHCVGLRQCRACWCGRWNVAWQSQNWRTLRGCFPCDRGCCFPPVILAARRWTRTRMKHRTARTRPTATVLFQFLSEGECPVFWPKRNHHGM